MTEKMGRGIFLLEVNNDEVNNQREFICFFIGDEDNDLTDEPKLLLSDVTRILL
jgi:hypothetical protein